jgi:hypothetical protein
MIQYEWHRFALSKGEKPRISPLRYAPVEMTKGRVVVGRGDRQGNGNRRSLHYVAEKSSAFGPHNETKSGSCSAATVLGSTAIPFVISTGAQRSGEICGFLPGWVGCEARAQ